MKKSVATAMLAALTFAAPLAVTSEAAAQHRGRGHDDHDGRDRDRDRDRESCDHHRGDRTIVVIAAMIVMIAAMTVAARNGIAAATMATTTMAVGITARRRLRIGYVDYGYRGWRRGDRLPAYYRDYYRPVDYRAYRLRAPPRGYHYVRDDRGDYLLVGIATGVILGIIASQ